MKTTRIKSHYSLYKLHSRMRFKIPLAIGGGGLYTLLYLSGVLLPVTAIFGVAALFIVGYIVKVLIQERHFGWIVLMVIMVGVPALFQFLPITQGGPEVHLLLLLLPVVSFYLYCTMLELSMGEWIAEASEGDSAVIDRLVGEAERDSNWQEGS